MEAAAQALGRFPDGVFFAPLAPLTSPESIVPTLLAALGLASHPGSGQAAFVPQADLRAQLLDYLGPKHLLLVMDNYEHLIAGPEPGRGQATDVVTDVLRAAPQVKILITSRASLGLSGEHLFSVGPLGLPEPAPEAPSEWHVVAAATEHSAVHLFLSAAQRVWGDFELTPDNLPHVVRVCRQVEGMPLGILLAAAWVKVLPPAEIAAEIGRGLDFLETEWRDLPPRQRSMRAVFDHSWRLLGDREREVMQALSVFRGSFTRQAAQEVAEASLRDLMALVDRSLLQRVAAQRYELHELLRQYAAEKLAATPDEGDAARDRHAAYYTAALERWARESIGPQTATWDEVETEFENARAAWYWAMERAQIAQLDRAIKGLDAFCGWARPQEGVAALRLAAEALEAAVGRLAAAGGEGPVPTNAEGHVASVAEVLRVWGKILTRLARVQGFFGESRGALRKGLALLDRAQLAGQDTRSDRAFALMWMGSEVSEQGRPQEAPRLYQESLALYRAVGDRSGVSWLLPSMGVLKLRAGAYEEARERFEESVTIGRSLGDLDRVRMSQAMLGLVACRQGRFGEAARLAETNPSVLAVRVLAYSGRFEEAHPRLEKEAQSSKWPFWTATLRVLLSATRVHLGHYQEARASVDAIASEPELFTPEEGPVAHLVVLGQVKLAEGAYAEAERQLQESAVGYRQAGWRDRANDALACLAYAARGLGQPDGARQHLREALRPAVEMGSVFPVIYGLPAFALLLVDDGEVERAVELYALASRYAFVAHSQWFEDVAGRHVAAAAESLPPEVVAAARERGRARDLWETAKELLEELEG